MPSESDTFIAALKDEEALSAYVSNWFPERRPKSAAEKEEIGEALCQLYRIADLEEPKLIWCESPYQLIIAPILMQVIANSDAYWTELLPNKLKVPRWRSAWIQLKQQLALNGLELSMTPELDLGDPFPPDWAGFWIQLRVRLDDLIRKELNPREYGQLHEVLARQPRSAFETLARDHWTRQLSAHVAQVCPSLRMEQARWDTLPDEFMDQLGTNFVVPLGDILETVEIQPTMTFPDAMYQTGVAFVDANRVINWSVIDSDLPVYSFALEKLADRVTDPNAQMIVESWRKLTALQMPFALYENFCFLCNDPISKSQDNDSRLHNESGPAIQFSDDFILYSWHGTTVPKWVIAVPERIGLTTIEQEVNAEIRRVLIERYGQEKFIRDSQVVPVQDDEFGVLYRREFLNDEPLVMVRVQNSTPEPDGSFKYYYLRVPPDIETAREAVAWTFGLNEAEYTPEHET